MELALLALGLLVGASNGMAQRPATAADVTEPLRDLDRALKITLSDTPADQADPARTLFVYIDATPSLKKAEFAAKFAHAIRENAKKLLHTRIGVAAVGKERPIRLAPTMDHAKVARFIEEMPATPPNQIHNVYAGIRRLAAAFKGSGQRDILLITLENGDAEDALETTVAHLKSNGVRLSAIVRESYISDSYWFKRRRYWHDTRRVQVPKDCELIGGDSPFIDLPWGWVFQQTVINEVVPSGFAVYGITRLAVATKGRVFLYSPPSAAKHRCAVYGACLFCQGDHLADGEAYAGFKLQELAPLAVSRKEAYRAVATDPYFRAVIAAWRAAAKAGVIQTSPAVQLVGATVRPDRNRGGAYLGFFHSTSFERHERRAQKAIAACSVIIDKLEQAMRDAASQGWSRAPGAGRQRAVAALTRVYLYLTRTNLVSFAGWCRDVAPQLIDKRRAAPTPPELPQLGEGRQAIGVTYRNFCLCHGVAPFFRVRLPGGKALTKELHLLEHVTKEFIRDYRQTPYAVALHRAGIARFHLIHRKPPARARTSSKTVAGPVTGGSARGRPVRNPGATTGGAASGPTTGRRP